MRLERTVVLPTTPEEAWSILIDWERQPAWMNDADEVEVLSAQREGVGVIIAVKTRVLGVPLFNERLEVMEWDPPQRLEVAHRSVVGGVGEWLLEPVGGGTRFSWIEDISLPFGLLGELALKGYRPVMRFLMDGALERLRRFVIATGPDRRASC